jgi:HlyD family secretion protein
MIRDTSAQDRRIAPKVDHKKRVIWIGVVVAGLVVVALCLPTVAHLLSADSSASTARLRIAEVKRGTLTRDVSVQGKIVAAVSPTLYARSAGFVDLSIHAGDKVKKDEVLAIVD